MVREQQYKFTNHQLLKVSHRKKHLLSVLHQLLTGEGRIKREAQMSLISLTRVFCHNLVKLHSVIIEILSFPCSVLFSVTADDNHFAMPNCKNIKMA